ncbi:hypothetical protein BDV38DRAFT_282594 [Aspergillus pseudotamarii]|uniref:Secreted protein n=1 Tax=Aspergillus pseudotamarii TaxID=132259 RepID=A0A5N6STM0_ASPPS|nr:uncharacterized protein BDV38DRAFT_282594 [Aspergillus pseudotamarii]KAE8137985.1 hypothetical protein BDV38DRAFT_282594 [Aspergillus pseudotamarii]
MKFLQTCSVLAVLVAFSKATSILSRLRSEEHHPISTVEDIPELSEGFSWRIVERLVGNGTRISRVVELDAQSNQLQKRVFAIGCVRISTPTTANISVKQLIAVEFALRHSKHAGLPPLIDDCNALNTQVKNYQSTLFVQPGYCHEATYGT